MKKNYGKLKVLGDGSLGIKGDISIRDKEGAITFINSIIEQFDITIDDLDI